MPPNQTGAAKTAAGGSSVRGRTKQEQDQLQRKTVYRPVLDNPLTVAWPPLPASVRKSILDQLLPILTAPQGPENNSIAEWRAEEHAARRHKVIGKGKGKGKGKKGDNDSKGKGKELDTAEDEIMAVETATEKDDTEPPSKKVRLEAATSPKPTYSNPKPVRTPRQPIPRPPLLDCLSLGINEVTKALETRIRWGRWELGDQKAMPGSSQLLQHNNELIPTAPVESGSGKGQRKRLRKKSNPTSFSPQVGLKLDSIDYSSLPSYEFVALPPPRPSNDRLPPYYFKPNPESPSPRLLINSETLRIKRAVRKETQRESIAKEKLKTEKSKIRRVVSVNGLYRTPFVRQHGRLDTDKHYYVAEQAEYLRKGQEERRKLEEAELAVRELEEDTRGESSTVPLIDLVFVCKPDINPPSLVAHLPGMVAAANGVQNALESVLAANSKEEKGKSEEGMEIDAKHDEEDKETRPEFGKVRIIPLDQGAERILADALGLRRVACIGLSSTAPGVEDLLTLISKHLSPPLAPWLTPHLLHPPPSSSSSRPSSHYVETHIKHLKTSAPLNPRAAHLEKKTQRKEEKKEKRRKLKEVHDGADVYVAEDED